MPLVVRRVDASDVSYTRGLQNHRLRMSGFVDIDPLGRRLATLDYVIAYRHTSYMPGSSTRPAWKRLHLGPSPSDSSCACSTHGTIKSSLEFGKKRPHCHLFASTTRDQMENSSSLCHTQSYLWLGYTRVVAFIRKISGYLVLVI